MKKLYIAEIYKIKRMKMTYVAYIGIFFSIIISSVQLLGRTQNLTFEQLASMSVYNSVLLVFPFCLSLIGGYIIDREYIQDTQKNLLTIPVCWGHVIKAKILVMVTLSIWIGLFSSIALILTGLILECSQMTIMAICKAIISNIVSSICVYIGTLPISLWFSKSRGKYLWGATLSLLLGVSGIFVAGGKAVNWHPITYCFSFVQYETVNASVLKTPFSCLAIAVYMFLATIIYVTIYKGEKLDV